MVVATQSVGGRVPAVHALPKEKVLELIATDATRGLSSKRATALLARHGPNDLADDQRACQAGEDSRSKAG